MNPVRDAAGCALPSVIAMDGSAKGLGVHGEEFDDSALESAGAAVDLADSAGPVTVSVVTFGVSVVAVAVLLELVAV